MKQLCSPHRRGFAAGFSLVELLVVIMIIGILLGLVVPAVNGIGRSSGLTTGGNTVVDLVNYAREEAMTKNTMTALVVLGQQPTQTVQDVDNSYRALTVLEFDPVTGWSQIREWEILPTGIVIDCNDPVNCSFLTHSPQPFPFLSRISGTVNPPVKYRGQQVLDGAGYAARIFLSNGSLQNPEQPAQLRLVEGFFQGNRVVYTNHHSGGIAANFYDIAILGMTGTTKINRP
ncbi:hypothetical protein CfE428DRAFT_0957 [Chthoniobacter flavus Ellin428]|uniref:Prepilin-type N-terminal cleavage/methylation domain-containing protein n=1 Tax=Chthoniobacter flavus Ellin428 TaxID=497964 RepID=B4CWC0_9BACT|nr:prepilin-type N-terminal cleavage/methylation domain-containing protein [Chthoniobacter flavus]EDY21712.1 hypothetical protein CfE428DRAFT_0957 [Chthoniobacter flavus Ellin428]TCO95647.1 prepilin-type N-terminal cleavage/methylation domain-containing protein [Chthoniobacter flavus]